MYTAGTVALCTYAVQVYGLRVLSIWFTSAKNGNKYLFIYKKSRKSFDISGILRIFVAKN